jgi:hypothetical protein
MSNKRREAEKNLGVFLSPTDMGGGGFLVPMSGLNPGPGEPGPGDDWHFPMGPVETADELITEPVPSDYVVTTLPRPAKEG